jgi:hypothetical protein
MRRSWKVGLLCALAVLSVPAGSAVQQQQAVAGHTVYGAMDGLDPCIAGIVGIVRTRVMWFNEQVLLETTPDDGSAYIYALQAGAPDPRDQLLTPTGRTYPFTDPNGLDWQVTEYNFTGGPDALAHGGAAGYHNGSVVATPPTVDDAQNLASYYVWVVRIGPTQQDTAATGRPYNFVDLVDTCKFTDAHPERTVHHSRDGNGTWQSDWGNDTTQDGHLPTDGPHDHDVYDINLYVGEEPKLAPVAQAESQYLGVEQ